MAKSPSRRFSFVIGALAAASITGAAFFVITKRKTTPTCAGVSPDGGRVNGIQYIETRRGSESPNARMPMVIVFHSRGGTAHGAAAFPSISPVRIIRPQGVTDSGNTWFSKSSHSTEVANSMASEMMSKARQLSKFIDVLRRCRPTIGRPIVTGSSEGGHVAYLLASTIPHKIGGAVGVLGYIPERFWTAKMAPTVGLHNSGDTTIPYKRTEHFWQTVRDQGADIHTEVFMGGHEIVPELSAAWNSSVSTMVERERSVPTNGK